MWRKLCSCNVKAPLPVQCHHIELPPPSGNVALDYILSKAIVLFDCDLHGIANCQLDGFPTWSKYQELLILLQNHKPGAGPRKPARCSSHHLSRPSPPS